MTYTNPLKYLKNFWIPAGVYPREGGGWSFAPQAVVSGVANHQRLAAQALAQWEAGVQFLDLQGIPFEI